MTTRRRFLLHSASVAAAASLDLPLARALDRNASPAHPQADLCQLVNPLIGTGWRGHTYPGAVAPLGLVQLSPDTAGAPEPRWNERGDYYGWEHCSGYHYPDTVIEGFTHTHVQGTGGKDLGDLLVMPLTKERNWSWQKGSASAQQMMQQLALGPSSGWVEDDTEHGYRSLFRHDTEKASPGRYQVHLDTPDVDADLVATTHCGLHRYRFTTDTGNGLLLDLVHVLGAKVYAAELTIDSSASICGLHQTHGWARDRRFAFTASFFPTPAKLMVQVDGTVSEAHVGETYKGAQIRLIAELPTNTKTVQLNVGISGVDVAGARTNLAQEVGSRSFEAVAAATRASWQQTLACATIHEPDAALAQTFYTAAYHSLTCPMQFSDVDGRYQGNDQKPHYAPDSMQYTGLSIWDIYRSQFPYIMLAQPARTSDMINSLLRGYREMGLDVLPMWPLWANETWSMDGFHAAAMILSAWARGFRGFNLEQAYEAVRRTALGGAETKGNRAMQAIFRERGFVPMESHGGAVSCTIDLAYDYWCAAAIAELLGHQQDAETFYAYSRNYRNLFDRSTGFMRGKSADGAWRTPFRPDEEYEEYVEADAWQGSFSVPHDVEGLIALHGGDAPFIERLEALFRAPSHIVNARPDITGMTGQNAQGNEPSNVHPFLFAFAGAAWKTQYWAHRVASLYRNTPEGIPGNDDCGQLSSWYLFAVFGFYPVNPGNGIYVLSSPRTQHATLRNPANGALFEVIAPNYSPDNIYIQSATLNNQPHTRSWIAHTEITGGGRLVLQLSNTPNRNWASAPADRPYSGMKPRT